MYVTDALVNILADDDVLHTLRQRTLVAYNRRLPHWWQCSLEFNAWGIVWSDGGLGGSKDATTTKNNNNNCYNESKGVTIRRRKLTKSEW